MHAHGEFGFKALQLAIYSRAYHMYVVDDMVFKPVMLSVMLSLFQHSATAGIPVHEQQWFHATSHFWW